MSMLKQFILFSKLKLYQRPQMLRVLVTDECPKVKEPKSYMYLTMDDMLIPSGSWKDHYKKRNTYYNSVLVFGSTLFVASIICLREYVFFNAFPPPYPFDKDTEDSSDENVNNNHQGADINDKKEF